MLRTFVSCALIVMLLRAPAALALDLWVDHDSMGGPCSDELTRDQVSSLSPWCTLGAAGSGVQPGDTVHVRGGPLIPEDLER